VNAPRWLIDPTVIRPNGVPDNAIVRVLRVPPEDAGIRLDVFLSGALRNTSRTRAKRIAENGAFCPEGKRRKPSERLQAEARVVLWRPPVDDADPEIELPVVYSDDHLLVLNKPPHVVPSEELRLNMSIAPCTSGCSTLGVIGGDNAGFPNGRRLSDDVLDISLQAVEGVLVGQDTGLGDAVDANDESFDHSFPYVDDPHDGSDTSPH